MAIVLWHGHRFSATPIKQLPNGDWLMTANVHGPRFTPGSEIEVAPGEIVEMASAEVPSETLQHAFTTAIGLEAAMAEERKTLPTPQELIGQARAAGTIVNAKQEPA